MMVRAQVYVQPQAAVDKTPGSRCDCTWVVSNTGSVAFEPKCQIEVFCERGGLPDVLFSNQPTFNLGRLLQPGQVATMQGYCTITPGIGSEWHGAMLEGRVRLYDKASGAYLHDARVYDVIHFLSLLTGAVTSQTWS